MNWLIGQNILQKHPLNHIGLSGGEKKKKQATQIFILFYCFKKGKCTVELLKLNLWLQLIAKNKNMLRIDKQKEVTHTSPFPLCTKQPIEMQRLGMLNCD